MPYTWPSAWFDDYNYLPNKPMPYLLLKALRDAIGWLRDNAYFGDRIDVTNHALFYTWSTSSPITVPAPWYVWSGAAGTLIEMTISGLINLPAPPAGKKWKITVNFYYKNPFGAQTITIYRNLSNGTQTVAHTASYPLAGAETPATVTYNETGAVEYFLSLKGGDAGAGRGVRRAVCYIQSEDS